MLDSIVRINFVLHSNMSKFIVVKRVINYLGFDLRRFSTRNSDSYHNIDILHDIKNLLGSNEISVFDVGANIGEWAELFSKRFNNISYYGAVEPDEGLIKYLHKNLSGIKNIEQFQIFNVALGSEKSNATLRIMNSSSMNSLHSLGQDSWGHEIDLQKIEVVTIDGLIHSISAGSRKIYDLLKIDSQGSDFEVLKGAKSLLGREGVNLVLCEVILQKLYTNTSYFVELFEYMLKLNYKVYGFYDQHNRNRSLAWFDVLFISDKFRSSLNSHLD